MPESKRQLAAIMFTDIVGYTSLMGKDEEAAFKLLRKNREIHRTLIEKYGGEWLKEMGDGILSSFHSSSDAVRCAKEIQENALEEKISLRIGIHEGEVVFEDGDVLGDGVNIASRLEASTAPGSILVSEAVYHNVRNKPDIQTDYVNETTFRNVDHPIRLYQIHFGKSSKIEIQDGDPDHEIPSVQVSEIRPPLPEDVQAQTTQKNFQEGSTRTGDSQDEAKRKQKVRRLSILGMGFIIMIAVYFSIFKKDKFEAIKDMDGRISLAVMPFTNLTGDTLYNWWQAGIQNILITDLSNSKELSVRQNHTMYLALASRKEIRKASITSEQASEIASELDAKIFIQGSILKAGYKIRLTAQLVNTGKEEIIKTYEVEGKRQDDFFSMTDSLSASIKNFLEIKKLAEDLSTPAILHGSINTQSSEAFKYFIFGYEDFSKLNLTSAVSWYLKAIEKDPDYINAYVYLIFSYGILGNDEQGRKYLNLVNEKKHVLPVREQLRLEHLNAYYYGNPEEEIRAIRQLLEIDEMDPTYWFILGRAYQKLKQYPEAIQCWEKTLQIYGKWGIQNPNWWIYYWLGDAYHQIGDHQKEGEIYEMGLSQVPDHIFIKRNQAMCALSRQSNTAYDNLKKEIEKSAKDVPEPFILSQLAWIYEKAGILDSAEVYYRQAVEKQPGNPEKKTELALFLIDHDRNPEEGMKLSEKVLEIEPDNWYALDARGWGLYKQGHLEEAHKVLKDAWPLRPSSALTDAYQHLQTVEKALAGESK